MLVQPFYRLAMFVTRSLHHPDNHFSSLARSVCNQFTKMVVIGIFQLVLDNHTTISAYFFSKDIYIETTDGRFPFLQFQLNIYRITQQRKIFLLR